MVDHRHPHLQLTHTSALSFFSRLLISTTISLHSSPCLLRVSFSECFHSGCSEVHSFVLRFASARSSSCGCELMTFLLAVLMSSVLFSGDCGRCCLTILVLGQPTAHHQPSIPLRADHQLYHLPFHANQQLNFPCSARRQQGHPSLAVQSVSSSSFD